VIALSGVTDPYQPVERDLRVTRGCLEVLAEFRNPVSVVTKNYLVTRDIDLLSQLAVHQAVTVSVSITTLNRNLQRRMEPRTSSPERRLAAVRTLAAAGIPTRVLVAPLIPGLTDHEIPKILKSAAECGASSAGFLLLRLPFAVKDLFADWMSSLYPLKTDKVLSRIAETRGGRMNDSRFHTRMRGQGTYARQIQNLFQVVCLKEGLLEDDLPLSTAAFQRPGEQLGLF
jgi:DNA repair photolyase